MADESETLKRLKERTEQLRAARKLPGAKPAGVRFFPIPPPPPPLREPCRYLGAPTGETVSCNTCRGSVQLKVFGCEPYGRCTLAKPVPDVAGCCRNCVRYSPEEKPVVQPAAEEVWAYGMTTVPSRRDSLLPRTLLSLAGGGFGRPRLFVDGTDDPYSWQREFGLEVTGRGPALRGGKGNAYGNWALALAELYVRQPRAERYAIFQDDLVCVNNLRAYLDACPYPERGYLNLYTVPANRKLAPAEGGWFESNQFGRGALALVFDRAAVKALLASPHMVERPQDTERGHLAVDGGVVTALSKAGVKEFCHVPSLVQHTGTHASAIGNKPRKEAEDFPGEKFDALELLSRRTGVTMTGAQVKGAG